MKNSFPSVDRQIYGVTPWGILPYLELNWQAFQRMPASGSDHLIHNGCVNSLNY